MLSPSSPVQKNFDEEDSSGSDAESEVGLETDRFGFLLTNGSTVGSVGPPPELVRQREAKWINIIGQWERILLKKTSKVKVQCQKGIPASLRAKCWPLLCGATDRMKQNENLYKILDSQPTLQNWVDVIERDLDRQFPFHEMFLSKDGHGQRGLFRVLKAYTQYQPEEGYCQAQGPVAAVLLMNMPAEETFWCLVQISEQYLPGYYSPLLEGVLFDAAMVTWVLKKTCPAAHRHLQHHGVEPLMFATDWLMCLFTRHLPFNTLLRVWDLFFCYGVRVLLQVAVVLVRRVLGRPEQRKQCQGQMETLERLRGVREQVQEEDDAFIAEVCSVPLSAKDLERQTDKALEKWRKDRPSSTFDPRGRCQGYRMAWARARHIEEERDRKERQKGNLSVPLARSASTLSLSPSLLHKKWRKGGKVNTGEWAGGGKVVRHLSMGAKEDWGSWTGLEFKKVQGVQEEEDVISEEHKKQSGLQPTGQTEQKGLIEEPKKMEEIPHLPKQHEEETEKVPVKPQLEQMEEENQQVGTEESTLPSGQPVNSAEEDTTAETEATQSLDGTQFAENTPHPGEPTPEQGEELDSVIQSHVPHQEIEGKDTEEETEKVKSAEKDTTTEKEAIQSQEETQFAENTPQPAQSTPEQGEELHSDIQSHVPHQEIEGKDTEEETEKQVEESEQTVAVDGNQTEVQRETNTVVEPRTQADVKLEEETETENVEEAQVGTATGVRVEAELVSEDEVQTVENPAQTSGTEARQRETDTSSQGGASEVKYNSGDSLAESDKTEEAHTQTETETDVLAQTREKDTQDQLEADGRTVSQQNTLPDTETNTEKDAATLPSPECIHDKEGSDVAVVTETEAEVPGETETPMSEAQSSEKESKAAGYEEAQNKDEISMTAHKEEPADEDASICDQTQVGEMPRDANEEGADTAASPEETSPQPVLNSTAGPGEATSSVQIAAVGRPRSQVTMGPVEEEKGPGLHGDTGEDCVFLSTQDSDPQAQKRDDSHPGKHQSEARDGGSGARDSRRSGSRSSGDVCVRKSSSSHGSRLARRLSEDLFTSPQKTNQPVPGRPGPVGDGESQRNPGVLTPTTPGPDVPPDAGGTDETVARQERDPPKRFGLFRRLRGEQSQSSKAKGATRMQVPKILIQDFSDGPGKGGQVDAGEEEKLSSRERRRRRRERERKEKEQERLRKKREKELEKEKERERRKPQTKGKSFQPKGKDGADAPQPANTGSQTIRYSVSYAESYF